MDSIVNFCADYWWIVLILVVTQVAGIALWSGYNKY